MKALYKCNRRNAITSLANKKKLSKNDICRIMNVCKPTLEGWIENAGSMRFKDMCTMAGLFNIGIHDFIDMIVKNKTRLSKDERWFADDSKYYGQLPD